MVGEHAWLKSMLTRELWVQFLEPMGFRLRGEHISKCVISSAENMLNFLPGKYGTYTREHPYRKGSWGDYESRT